MPVYAFDADVFTRDKSAAVGARKSRLALSRISLWPSERLEALELSLVQRGLG